MAFIPSDCECRLYSHAQVLALNATNYVRYDANMSNYYYSRDILRFLVKVQPKFDKAWLLLAQVEYKIGHYSGTSGYFEGSQIYKKALTFLKEDEAYDIYKALDNINSKF